MKQWAAALQDFELRLHEFEGLVAAVANDESGDKVVIVEIAVSLKELL